MVSISTHTLTEWELPGSISAPATALKSSAESFASHVESAESSWSSLPGAYTGPAEGQLFSALDPAGQQAGALRDAAQAVEIALSDFAAALQSLRSERQSLLSEISSFNLEHAGETLDDLESSDISAKNSLEQSLNHLQSRYEELVFSCVGQLDGVAGGGDAGMGGDSPAGTTPAAGGSGDHSYGEVGESLENIDTYGNAILSGIEGPITEHAWTQTHLTDTSPHGSQHSVSFERTTTQHGWSLFGVPLSAGMSGMMGGFAHQLRQDAARNRERGSRMQRFAHHSSRAAIGSIPLAADLQAWRDGARNPNSFGSSQETRTRATAHPDGNSQVQTEQRTTNRSSAFNINGRDLSVGNMANRGLTSLGSAGTVLTSAAHYNSYRDQRMEELEAENPDMSQEEVESEASHDAGANTAGNVATSIVATAAGAGAAGSVIPGAGTATAFVGGLIVGAAAEIPIVDVTGDGEADSLTDIGGHYAEQTWDWARNEAAPAISDWTSDRVDDVSDGLEAAGDWASDRADDVGDGLEAAGEWADENLNPFS